MLAYASRMLSAGLRPFRPFLSSPGAALAVCYAAGLLVSRLMGEGPAGLPLLIIGAPVALGMLVRFGRGLSVVDAAGLAAAHVGVSILFREPLAVWMFSLARDLIEISCGSLLFARLRADGLITSPLRVAAAAIAVSVASPIAAAPVGVLAMTVSPAASIGIVMLRCFADGFAMVMILGVILTYGRDGVTPTIEQEVEEPKPPFWEYVASGLLVAALTLGAIDSGWLMSSFAASVALLWFALRLGLFATTVAAFAFVGTLLCFAGVGRWTALFDAADPLQAQALLYVSLALLAGPSMVVAAVVHDQSRQRRIFAYRAMHDGLTTLVNRSRFIEALDGASAAARGRGKRFALLLIDLDHFKTVNDTYGHARGDKLLVEIASRLRQSVRVTDLVARIGGDEFAVVAPVPTIADAITLAKRLVETVNEVCDLQGVSVRPSITVGGVLSPDSATDPQLLMVMADEALYEAKAAGRNCWRFASSDRVALANATASGNDMEFATEQVFLD